MSPKTIKSEVMEYLTTLVQIVANQYRISVVYSEKAETFSIERFESGDFVIVIPNQLVAFDGGNLQQVKDLINGGVAHEAVGHGRHTDFSLPMQKWSRFKTDLVNVLEDVRIEKLASRCYAGTGMMLSKMVEILESKDLWGFDADQCDESLLLIGLLRRYRTNELLQPLDKAVTQRFEDDLAVRFQPGLMADIDVLALQACRAKTTAIVAKKADEIIALLKTHHPDFSERMGGNNLGIDRNVSKVISDLSEEPNQEKVKIGKCDLPGPGRTEKGTQKEGHGSVPSAVVAGKLLRANIEKIFVSQESDVEEIETRRGPELNSQNLALIAAGLETRPFLDEDDIVRSGLDTDVVLYVDSSGSIGSTVGREFMAEIMVAFGYAFSRFVPRARLKIASFANTSKILFDSHTMTWRAHVNRVVGGYFPDGGTHWMSGGVDLLSVLSSSKKQRKVMLTMTDGLLGPKKEIDGLMKSAKLRHGVESVVLSMGCGSDNQMIHECHVSTMDHQKIVQALIERLRIVF